MSRIALPEENQADLFNLGERHATLLPGLHYEESFLEHAEQDMLTTLVQRLPLEEARYKEYTAQRRVLSFGGNFDYDTNRLMPAAPLIDELLPLRARVAAWMEAEPEDLVHTLVAEYAPGVQLGWHRDVPDFERVAGVSLGATAQLRFRPCPPCWPRRGGILKMAVQPGSLYVLEGPARWEWQHSVSPLEEWRWSITFRTAARRHRGIRRD